MPAAVRKKTQRTSARNKAEAPKKEVQKAAVKETSSRSYTSLILGGIVVLVIGVIILSFLKINRDAQTSSTNDFVKIDEEDLQGQQTSSTYTVKAGDDLWTISDTVLKDGYRWVEIAKLNNIQNPDKIYAGDKLKMPAKKTAVTKANGTPIKGNSYTVAEGDCLWDIAVRAYGDGFKWTEIAKVNKLTNPDIIHPGNKLSIPR